MTSFIHPDRRTLLKGAAAVIFARAAPLAAQTERTRLTLQEYCERQKRIFQTNPAEFVNLVNNFTPFARGEMAEAPFSSSHGPITVRVPSETFIPFGRRDVDQWGPEDVSLLETGGTIAAVHGSLGVYNNNDPSNITRAARLAAQDISIQSQYVLPLIRHLISQHDLHLKETDRRGNLASNSNNQLIDSEEFSALKEDAKRDLILG